MIEIEIASIKHFSAVLAGVFVTLKNIVPSEFDLLFWKTIKNNEQNHLRNADAKRDGSDAFAFISILGEGSPASEIKGLKGSALFINHLRSAFKKECKCASCAANMDRLPKPIENQHGILER